MYENMHFPFIIISSSQLKISDIYFRVTSMPGNFGLHLELYENYFRKSEE